jgi:hypothetical protein
MTSTHKVTLLAATAALCLAAIAPADAATVSRTFYQNGGSACTGALPTYEGALRKRPKAIANEGTTGAFITCSAITNDLNSAKPAVAFAYFTNRGASATSVSCTFVNGDEFYGSTATPQTLPLASGQFLPMFFVPPSGPEFDRFTINLSCSLPPGVELNLFGHNIEEDVGA